MSGIVDSALYDRVRDDVAAFMPDQTSNTVYHHGGVYRRAPRLELSSELTTLVATVGHNLSFAEFTCDRLDIANGSIVHLGNAVLVIYARLCFSEARGPLVLDCKKAAKLMVLIYAPGLPVDFVVKIKNLGEVAEQQKKVAIPSGYRGVRLFKNSEDDAVSVVGVLRPEPAELASYDELASMPGDTAPSVFRNDNLIRLLRYQFLLATAWLVDNPGTAVSILQWISGLTSKSSQPAAVELYFQCSTLMSRVSIANSMASFYTPLLDLSICEKVLSARLTAAMAFESSYQLFATSAISSTNFKDSAALTLQRSKDVDEQYRFLSGVAKARYENAKRALYGAHVKFRILQDDLPSKYKAFRRGIENWKTESGISAAISGILAVTQIVMAVLSMVALGAPVAGGGEGAGGLASGAKSIKEGNEIWEAAAKTEKQSKVVIEMKEFVERFADVVAKFVEITEWSIQMSEIAETFKVPGEMNGDKLKEPKGVDNPELVLAGWDTFRDRVTSMFAEVPVREIDFAEEYKLALFEQAILGKAVTACQRAVIQAGDEYTRTLVALRVSQAETARLTKAVDKVGEQASLLSAFKSSLFRKLLVTRSWVFLDFQQYVAAYCYFALADSAPIQLSPLRSAAGYAGDAATLQAAVAMVALQFKGQLDDGIVFRTDDKPGSNVFGDAWKNNLVEKRGIVFSIDVDDPRFKRYGRVRVQRVRVYLEFAPDIRFSKSDVVTLHAILAPQLVDRGPRPAFTPKPFFLMDRIELDFAYFPGADDRVKVDGVFVDAWRYVRPTPFTEWTLQVVEEDLDLTAVQAVRLELACEFS